jgi:uncharacterized protein YdeI (YjbR/CyaY-like superfamily)
MAGRNTAVTNYFVGLQTDRRIQMAKPLLHFSEKNIIIIGKFKDYCSLSFAKGVLLQDADKLLEAPSENSQSVRIAKFTDVQQITNLETTLKAYIYEAIELEKAELKVKKKESTDLTFPDELTEKFTQNPEFQEAFTTLTPGRQRGYIIFFSAAKQDKTRVARIEKYVSRILDGKGINDCTYGHSKRMPACDGSHRYI